MRNCQKSLKKRESASNISASMIIKNVLDGQNNMKYDNPNITHCKHHCGDIWYNEETQSGCVHCKDNKYTMNLEEFAEEWLENSPIPVIIMSVMFGIGVVILIPLIIIRFLISKIYEKTSNTNNSIG